MPATFLWGGSFFVHHTNVQPPLSQTINLKCFTKQNKISLCQIGRKKEKYKLWHSKIFHQKNIFNKFSDNCNDTCKRDFLCAMVNLKTVDMKECQTNGIRKIWRKEAKSNFEATLIQSNPDFENTNPDLQTSSYSNFETGLKPLLFYVLSWQQLCCIDMNKTY